MVTNTAGITSNVSSDKRSTNIIIVMKLVGVEKMEKGIYYVYFQSKGRGLHKLVTWAI